MRHLILCQKHLQLLSGNLSQSRHKTLIDNIGGTISLILLLRTFILDWIPRPNCFWHQHPELQVVSSKSRQECLWRSCHLCSSELEWRRQISVRWEPEISRRLMTTLARTDVSRVGWCRTGDSRVPSASTCLQPSGTLIKKFPHDHNLPDCFHHFSLYSWT